METSIVRSVAGFVATPTGILLVSLIGLAIFYLNKPKPDPLEPPTAKGSFIPVLDFFAFLREPNLYLKRKCEENPHPVFTLDFGFRRLYVINDPDTANYVYTNFKTFNADTVSMPIMFRMSDMGAEDIHNFNPNKDPNMPNGRMLQRHTHVDMRPEKLAFIQKGMFDLMGPGLTRLMSDIRRPGPDAGVSGLKLNLYERLRSVYIESFASAFWGPDFTDASNPLLAEHMRAVEPNFLALGTTPTLIRNWTMAESVEALRKLKAMFLNYYGKGGQEKASAPIRNRFQNLVDMPWSFDAISSTDFAFLLASGNLVNITFWILSYIYADPALLADIRAELQRSRAVSADAGNINVDPLGLAADSPLIVSVYYEALRVKGTGRIARQVMTDTRLPSGHVLKKGAVATIVNGQILSTAAAWGPGADRFDPRRFVDKEAFTGDKKKAFLVFGNGPTHCPGRFLAQDVVVSMVAGIVLAFDLGDVGGGEFSPRLDQPYHQVGQLSTPEPKGKLAEIRMRDCAAQVGDIAFESAKLM